jgi:hypothetical protein
MAMQTIWKGEGYLENAILPSQGKIAGFDQQEARTNFALSRPYIWEVVRYVFYKVVHDLVGFGAAFASQGTH